MRGFPLGCIWRRSFFLEKVKRGSRTSLKRLMRFKGTLKRGNDVIKVRYKHFFRKGKGNRRITPTCKMINYRRALLWHTVMNVSRLYRGK